jgi:hypothetical protein
MTAGWTYCGPGPTGPAGVLDCALQPATRIAI